MDGRVTRVVWAHGRTGPAKEAETYAYDEQGRLTGFQQGNWDDAVPGITGTLTAAHDYTLDDQGNWREHRDGDSSTPVLVPPIDKINAYEEWKVPQKLSGGGTGVKTLDLKYSRVLGFLWERELRNGDKVNYQHDGLGRLVSVKQESTVLVRYGYDAEGRLAWRKTGTNPREWLVYDGDRVLQEVRESAQGGGPFAVIQEYAWSGNQLERSYDGSGNEYFLHQDRLGSVVWATRKESGVTIKTGHAAYDPYGRPVTLPGKGPNFLPVPYGYAGARFEDMAAPDEDITLDGTAEKLGLYLMGARWYDPELGRFLEQDPIGEAGGLNLYNYVNSSPTMWIDPSGLYRVPVVKGGQGRGPDYYGGSGHQRWLAGVLDRLNVARVDQLKKWDNRGKGSEESYQRRKARGEKKKKGDGGETQTNTMNQAAQTGASQTPCNLKDEIPENVTVIVPGPEEKEDENKTIGPNQYAQETAEYAVCEFFKEHPLARRGENLLRM